MIRTERGQSQHTALMHNKYRRDQKILQKLKKSKVKKPKKNDTNKKVECLQCFITERGNNYLSIIPGIKPKDNFNAEINFKFQCHICKKGFKTEHQLRFHLRITHEIYPPRYEPPVKKDRYDSETMKWLEKRSTENIFLHFGTDLSTYNKKVKIRLEQDGMISQRDFSEKALEIMRNIGLEPVHKKEKNTQ